MKYVIMAAVAPFWAKYGVARQMLKVNDEPLLFRTIRLLRERIKGDLYLTVPKKGFFGDTGCIEVENTDSSGMGRFLNFKDQFEDPTIFFYGDVYYTRDCIDTILKDTNSWQFFGRGGASTCGGKGWGEPFAMKANKEVMEKAAELKVRAQELGLQKCICWDLYRYMNNYPPNVHYVKDNFTEISDLSDDIDYDSDYMDLNNRCSGNRIYYCESMKLFGQKVGLKRYNPIEDIYRPTLFLGLYFNEDYQAFKNHKGDKEVFWNGSDVLKIKEEKDRLPILKSTRALHRCHNKQLQKELSDMGIEVEVKPRFFGKIEDYPVSYEPSDFPQVYMTCNTGREKEYGIPQVLEAADKLPIITFHIYGINGTRKNNVIFHGWVPEEQMDKEIRKFQGCLRLNKHDGFSQTLMKSILLGQHQFRSLNDLIHINEKPPNIRDEFIKSL